MNPSRDHGSRGQSPSDLRGLRLAIASDTFLPQLNGVTRTLDRLARTATARGAEVRIYTADDPGADVRKGVRRYRSIPFWGYPQLRIAAPRSAQMERDLTAWGAQLVHAASPFGVGLAARGSCRATGIPFVTSYHTSLNAYARFYRLGWLDAPGWSYLRWFHNSGARTFCPTSAVSNELAARGFDRLCIWGRGVDSEMFAPRWRSLEFRRAHGVLDTELLVLYVGRIAREKGLDVLLDAMRHLTHHRVRLMLVGDGPYERVCRDLAVPGTVFTGPLSGRELAHAFASADLFVFPSMTDTFGNVLLEAMASGLPVLAAECAVTREQLDPASGAYYPGDDPRALADKLLALREDPARRHAAGSAGRSVTVKQTWDRVFDGLFAEYLSVLRSSTREGRRARNWFSDKNLGGRSGSARSESVTELAS